MSVAVKTGDYVRVVLEGQVKRHQQGDIGIAIGTGHGNWISPNASHVKSIEVIPEPEAWQYGDVVVDAEGDVFKRIDLDRDRSTELYFFPWRGLSGRNQAEYYPTRPLTLLVRGNKAVNNG